MSTPRSEPTLGREAATITLRGDCDSSGVAKLDISRTDFSGVRSIDISGVGKLDSTGVALIGELVAQVTAGTGQRPTVSGRPPGLDDLCRAYRIAPDFSDFP